jgi:hypothetical protein
MNHGSTPVRRARSIAAAPRRNAASSTHNRSSVAGMSSGNVSPQSRCSQRIVRLPSSSERTAFCSAASNVRSIAMTSPVAFIWVPRRRSPNSNLSKGQRGIFTTQ